MTMAVGRNTVQAKGHALLWKSEHNPAGTNATNKDLFLSTGAFLVKTNTSVVQAKGKNKGNSRDTLGKIGLRQEIRPRT